MDRSHNVGTIEIIIKLARIVFRKEGIGISGLKAGDGRNPPAFGNFAHHPVITKWAVPRYLPNRTDHEALRGIEVGQATVEGGIGGIGKRRRARAESRRLVNRLRVCVSQAELQMVRQPLINSELKLIAG